MSPDFNFEILLSLERRCVYTHIMQ